MPHHPGVLRLPVQATRPEGTEVAHAYLVGLGFAPAEVSRDREPGYASPFRSGEHGRHPFVACMLATTVITTAPTICSPMRTGSTLMAM